MAITFNCRHCGKSLTTTDDKAGRQAKCPGCGELIVVPKSEAVEDSYEEAALDDDGAEMTAPSPATKSCPMCGAENPRRAKACQACGEAFETGAGGGRRGKGFFEPGDVISASWTIYMKQLGLVLGSVLIAGLIANAASLPSQVLSGINSAREEQGHGTDPLLMIGAIVLMLPSYVLGWFLQIGVTKVLLKVARGKETSLGEMFSGGRYFLRMLGSTLLFGLMLVGAALACFFPMFLVLFMFWPYVFVLVDEHSEGISCLWRAKEITQGTWGSAFVLFLAAMGINILGIMACCVGIIFTAPLTQLMFAVAYCRMTAQSTAEESA